MSSLERSQMLRLNKKFDFSSIEKMEQSLSQIVDVVSKKFNIEHEKVKSILSMSDSDRIRSKTTYVKITYENQIYFNVEDSVLKQKEMELIIPHIVINLHLRLKIKQDSIIEALLE